MDNLLHALKRKRLSEDITEQLKKAIYEGSYRPGDRLPSENALGEIFQVGRPVVREALRALENSGLIFVRPGAGGGAFVKKIGSGTLSQALEGIVRLDNISMEELTEARLAVETAILPLAMKGMTSKDIESLEENIREARRCLDEGIHEPKNLKFHILLARASHNALLIKICEALLKVMARLLEAYDYSYERKKTILQEHEELLALIKSNDFEALRRALEKHIRDTNRLFDVGR
ncbi:MAG: FadR family transcriptional regulator [Deltaproteobacteria bacterium]|nr:FadR family transcriptional regulator [Deltaproteobacteria bacterium]